MLFFYLYDKFNIINIFRGAKNGIIKQDKENYMTTSEAANFYGVHADTIKKWIKIN